MATCRFYAPCSGVLTHCAFGKGLLARAAALLYLFIYVIPSLRVENPQPQMN